MKTYGRFTCDAYHGGLVPPLATVDWGRLIQCVGIPGNVRFLCDKHARGLRGWRDRCRMAGAPELVA